MSAESGQRLLSHALGIPTTALADEAAPAQLIGDFEIVWMDPATGARFVVEGAVELERAAEGRGVTEYDLSGTAQMITDRFALDEDTCALSGASSRAILDQEPFVVWARPRSAVRWSFVDQWAFGCDGDGGHYEWILRLDFAMRTGASCAQLDEAQVDNPSAPAGAYHLDCGGGARRATATWALAPPRR